MFPENGNEHFFGSRQVELLQAIKSCGAIDAIGAAAKTVGISYKTAWDRLSTMTNLLGQTLVQLVAVHD